MSKRKREEESGYKTAQEFYEGEWENLQNELLHEDDKRLTDATKFKLKTIMDGPAQDLDAAAKYKFLDTIRINHKHRRPIRDTLNELSWRVISNDRKKGNDKKRELLEVIRTGAQGGRKRKRRRSTKKKRRKRNSKKRTRRRKRRR